jgi:hypothetical protein
VFEVLGEQIGEEQGRVLTRRVLPGDGTFVKMEITFEAQVTILGVTGMDIGTYTVYERIPGQLYGEGQGILMTADGGGAIGNGFGIGQARADGSLSFAASVSFQTNVESLARLNSVLGVVEHPTDMEGNARSAIYEWKPA